MRTSRTRALAIVGVLMLCLMVTESTVARAASSQRPTSKVTWETTDPSAIDPLSLEAGTNPRPHPTFSHGWAKPSSVGTANTWTAAGPLGGFTTRLAATWTSKPMTVRKRGTALASATLTWSSFTVGTKEYTETQTLSYRVRTGNKWSRWRTAKVITVLTGATRDSGRSATATIRYPGPTRVRPIRVLVQVRLLGTHSTYGHIDESLRITPKLTR